MQSRVTMVLEESVLPTVWDRTVMGYSKKRYTISHLKIHKLLLVIHSLCNLHAKIVYENGGVDKLKY